MANLKQTFKRSKIKLMAVDVSLLLFTHLVNQDEWMLMNTIYSRQQPLMLSAVDSSTYCAIYHMHCAIYCR